MMTKRLFVLPYKAASASAKALAQSLNCKRLKLENSTYQPRRTDLIINWGNQRGLPRSQIGPENILNDTVAVSAASCKLNSFELMSQSGVSVPEWTTQREVAAQWVEEGATVVARTLLRASSGRGIVLASDLTQLQDAPLYVKYVPKKDEYRVHVFAGHVIDVQRKMRKSDVPDDDVNWKIRNLSGGFIFGREGVALPDVALDTATEAVASLGLDFGAVDLIWNERSNTYYVLEVNTAPGLAGTTLQKYTEAIQEFNNERG